MLLLLRVLLRVGLHRGIVRLAVELRPEVLDEFQPFLDRLRLGHDLGLRGIGFDLHLLDLQLELVVHHVPGFFELQLLQLSLRRRDHLVGLRDRLLGFGRNLLARLLRRADDIGELVTLRPQALHADRDPQHLRGLRRRDGQVFQILEQRVDEVAHFLAQRFARWPGRDGDRVAAVVDFELLHLLRFLVEVWLLSIEPHGAVRVVRLAQAHFLLFDEDLTDIFICHAPGVHQRAIERVHKVIAADILRLLDLLQRDARFLVIALRGGGQRRDAHCGLNRATRSVLRDLVSLKVGREGLSLRKSYRNPVLQSPLRVVILQVSARLLGDVLVCFGVGLKLSNPSAHRNLRS